MTTKTGSPYILYGWHLSYFTGKVRSYLRYKNIPFIDQPVDFYTLTRRIKRRTGAAVMPVLVTPEGEWLQDSSVIIDRLEERFPARSVLPIRPIQCFAAHLIEAWGDEWWIPIALHTRWSHPENYPLFEREGGQHLLPWFPRFIQRRAAARAANRMRRFMPLVGVVPEQTAILDAWTATMLDHLDRHFAAAPFLLGRSPSIGDFGLLGSMYGHLGRDPWPKRELVAPRPHLRDWIDRMAELPPGTAQGFADGDVLPPTLEPVLRSIFA